MERTFITITEYCSYHNVEPDFVNSLADGGLVQLTVQGKEQFIPYEQLTELERYCRLHYDLEINLEGLAAISHLLSRVNSMQRELVSLQNQLRFHQQQQNNKEDY